VEQSAHLHPGIKSITPAQTQLFGIALFSKYFKRSENEVEFSLVKKIF